VKRGHFANHVLAAPEYVELFEDICGSVLTPRKRLDSHECREKSHSKLARPDRIPEGGKRVADKGLVAVIEPVIQSCSSLMLSYRERKQSSLLFKLAHNELIIPPDGLD